MTFISRNWRFGFQVLVLLALVTTFSTPIIVNAQPAKCTTVFTAPVSSSSTFSDVPNQTVVASANVRVLLSEGFEVGAFPPGQGNWNVTGAPQWDDETYKPFTGSWSAWAAGGGTGALNPASGNYANNMNSWMIAGPFDLSLSLAPRVLFNWWNISEANYDRLYWLASTNGTNFHGYASSGNTGGWRFETFDLTSVPTLGNLAGQSRVWIAFRFQSDSTCTYQGAFVDNVTLDQRRWGAFYNPNPVAVSGNTSLADNNNADSSTLTNLRNDTLFQGLDGTGWLRGTYVNLVDGSGNFSSCNSGKSRGLATNSSLIFDYTRSNDRFEEANVYYHIDKNQRYIQSLGSSYNTIVNQQIAVHAHCYIDFNANASSDFSLRFGDGGVYVNGIYQPDVDMGEDSEVIIHEYAHLIQWSQIPNWLTSTSSDVLQEQLALSEGFADYWAGSYFAQQQANPWDVCIGEWVLTNPNVFSLYNSPRCARRLDNLRSYPGGLDPSSPHFSGEIWSGGLWELWQAIGRNTTDQLVLHSHFSFDAQQTRFGESVDALVNADNTLNAGVNNGTIVGIFKGRGILDSSERDDLPSLSQPIVPNGSSRTNRFYSINDTDWLRFGANAYGPNSQIGYRIKTYGLAFGVDTEIAVVSNNQVTVLASNSDCALGDPSSCVIFLAPTTATYYIRITPQMRNVTSTGRDKIYSVEISTIALPYNLYLPLVMK